MLSTINHRTTVAAGDATDATVARIGVNYLVPFVVSSVGYLAPFRTPSTSAE